MDSGNEDTDSGAIAKLWLWGVNIIALLFIGGIIYSFLTPPTQMNPESEQSASFDAEAKSNLKNLYLACSKFWEQTQPENLCDIKTASKAEYGHVSKAGIVIGGPLGTKTSFEAWGKYFSSSRAYAINSSGEINKIGHKMNNGLIEKVNSINYK